MTEKILQLTSPTFRLRVTEPEIPFHTVLDGWRIEEIFQRPRMGNLESFGEYRLSLEHLIENEEDAGGLFINGEFLAQQMEKAWLYGTGIPLGARGYDYLLLPAHFPARWQSNAHLVLPESDWSLLRDGASYAPSQRSAPHLPLRQCIEVVDHLATADEVTLQIIAYHFGAVTTTDEELHFLLFAQALEMGRELLPDASKSKREDLLPEAIRSRLTRGLDWLFNISNQRRQTRHAVNKKKFVELKPSLEDDEERDFIAGANLLLLYLVTTRLDLPVRIFENGATIEAG